MNDRKLVLTILGSAGGLARSLLALLNKASLDQHDPIQQKLYNSTIHLIDYKQRPLDYYQRICPNLIHQLTIHQMDLKDTIILRNFLKESHTALVIDVSLADSVEMLDCCNQLGVHYVNSALENIYIQDHANDYKGFPLIERLRFFEKYKQDYTNLKAIICSGMNPGVVQWMAIELMNHYPNEQPLACLIVEHNSSFLKLQTAANKNAVYTTKPPDRFLTTAIQNFPMFMQNRTPLFLNEQVYDLGFRATLGDKQFHGCLLPNEAVYFLCKQYDMEGGYLYKVNDHTTSLIRENVNHPDKIGKLDKTILAPLLSPLDGENLVGVLLIYPDKERYMYHGLSNEGSMERFNTNAAYFQAASGLYAALAVILNDGIPNGVYSVDELLLKTTNHYGQYLSCHLTDFVCGENTQTDGLLLERMKNPRTS
ncbi:S-adenosylmethionine decarboxylase related protein [Bacillus sp. ISL-18]|uniref:S-adenosylmethionine decarboxylase related protein n=1 Tax=Bacillus sp. ISL-18 TaxID=2819118 RepID=UPI001BECDB49|nr:S-adenosylmethionine decarboxylase related protein [Bacillus sp. ISL-18]MBT2658056.1 S-adenosylmethionine decarboxylase related protein [Bacillus sp. ISL-18]